MILKLKAMNNLKQHFGIQIGQNMMKPAKNGQKNTQNEIIFN